LRTHVGCEQEGCYVVRNSSTKGLYTLSLYTKIPHSQVSRVISLKYNTGNDVKIWGFDRVSLDFATISP
jgi:hypothetical protein